MNGSAMLNNLLQGLLKGAIAAAGGTATFTVAPLLFPHCGSLLCAFLGATIGTAIWSGLHQSSFQKAP